VGGDQPVGWKNDIVQWKFVDLEIHSVIDDERGKDILNEVA
jgi:hypothetical protein